MIYEINSLSFSYPGSKRQVLNDISFCVAKGEVHSILGPNGAGKSTLLGCMMGLLRYNSGSVLLNEREVRNLSPRDIASLCGYVPQLHQPTFEYTVIEFVLMGLASSMGLFGKPGAKEYAVATEALQALGISNLAEQPYTRISGGERQKASIARAIAAKPLVVLFDEPTAHLDYGSQGVVLKLIKSVAEMGYAVISTTHNPDHALLLGGQAALLDKDGVLVYGPATDIITAENLSRIYECEVHLEYIPSLKRHVCIYAKL